jgi:mono/diheme cytochrome c family protein
LRLAVLFLPVLPVAAGEQVDYARDVKPVLMKHCVGCHGALKQESALRVDTAALLQKGGHSGAAVAPGSPDESLLLERVTSTDESLRMPAEGKPLSAEQIAILRKWIEQGAIAPDDEQPEEDPREHWAFRPLQKPVVPDVRNANWPANPIDAFVSSAHEEQRLSPNPPARQNLLLRRVCLDLIGVPPSRRQLHAFLADQADDSYARVVDRLLESPQYGERWGRHWMDVWRYSDWYGRRSVGDVRNSYPFIWRWRDWIIRSLNDDKGYDRMVLEMLAADELAPLDDQNIVATGFIVRNWFSMNYNQWMRDMVEHTGKAFLGLRFNCAHCHDHKYDPISQQDYFRLRAFFEPLEIRHDRVPGEPDPGRFRPYVYPELKKPITGGLVRVVDSQLDAETFLYTNGDARNRVEGHPPLSPGVPEFLSSDSLVLEAVRLPPQAYYPALKSFIRAEENEKLQAALKSAQTDCDNAHNELTVAETKIAELDGGQPASTEQQPTEPEHTDATASERATLVEARGKLKICEARLASARADLTSLEARIAADDVKCNGAEGDADSLFAAASQAERQASLSAAKLMLLEAEAALATSQQNADSKKGATAVEKAAAEIIKSETRVQEAHEKVAAALAATREQSNEYTPIGPVYAKTSTGRRTALGRWIVSRTNPLTARVAVNHIWMRHFGKPLVASVFDFGRSGHEPTHPELLDWLAAFLIEHEWRMKPLHRLIVTSEAYRMRSQAGDASNRAADRDNQFLWHFPVQRMQSEAIRDSVLFASGALDQTIGGPELDNTTGSVTPRRSLYFCQYPESGGQMQLTSLFDAASPADCYRRTNSVVPQQALAMTNSRLMLNQSRLLARKLWQEIADAQLDDETAERSFIVALFEQLLSSAPSPAEESLCREFLDRQRALVLNEKIEKPAEKVDEAEVTASTDPAMRARESLVRALFSHNSFVTIR